MLRATACRSIDTETAVSPSLFQDVAAEALRQLYGYVGGAVETHVLAVSGIEVTIKVDQRYSATCPGFSVIQTCCVLLGLTGCRLVMQGLEEAVVGVDVAYALPINQKQVRGKLPAGCSTHILRSSPQANHLTCR